MKLIGDNASIQLDLEGFTHATSIDDAWDGKWIVVDAYIKLDGFQAFIPTELLIDELIAFQRSLEGTIRAMKGKAVLHSIEESIFLEGTVTTMGKVNWEGCVVYPVAYGNKLNFHFRSDFQQLIEIHTQLTKEINH